MSATAGTLTLIVDSSSVSDGERALDNIARTGARVEGSLKIDMGSIEKAMARLGQQVTSLDSTMTAGMGRVTAASHAQAKTFDQLRASIDPAYATTMRFKEVQQQLAAMVSSGEASQRAANIVLEQAASRYMGVSTAAERVAEAERQAAQASATASQNYEALRASVDPLFATSKRYEAALETLTAAQKSGAISDSERTRTLQLVEARLIGAGQGATVATSRFSKLFASVGGGQMALRQTAFQLNQVAQQGAVTGNYIQALSIQSADLLTVFGMWGILAGGVVAVMGPMITSFLTGAESAKNLDESFRSLSDSTSAYTAAMTAAQRSISDLYGEFGTLAGRAREVLKVQRELAEFAAIQSQKAAISGVVDEFGKLTNIIGLSNEELESQLAAFARYDPALTGARATRKEFSTLAVAVNDITGELGVSKEAAVAFAVAMRGAANADDPDARATALAKARDALMAAAKEQGGLNDLGAKYIGLLTDAELAALAVAAGTSKAAGETNNWADAMFGVRAEIVGIISALSQIGGGVISNAAKQVEIDALKMGKTLQQALQARREFEVNAEFDQKVAGAGTWMEAQALKVQKSVALVGVELDKEATALRKTAQSTKKAVGASARAAKESERQLDAIRASIDPFHSYNKKMKELVALKKHLSDDEMAMAIKNLNLELADSLPMVGELSDAIAGAIVAGDSLSDAFANVLRQMAQDALSSGIKAILTDQLTPGTGGGGFFGTLLGGLLGGAGATGSAAVTEMAGRTDKTDWFDPPLNAAANSTEIPKSFGSPIVNASNSNRTMLTVVVDVAGANGDEAIKQIAEEATRKGIEQAAPRLIGASVDATYDRSAEYPLGKRR